MTPNARSLDPSENIGIMRARPRTRATDATVLSDPHIVLISKEVNVI